MQALSSRTRFMLLAAGFFLLWIGGRSFHFDPQAIEKVLSQFPLWWSGGVFILSYVVVTFFIWFSKDIFRVAAALVFGAYVSTLLVFLAEVGNALILFPLARYGGRGYLEELLQKHRIQKLDDRIASLGAGWLFLFRVAPLISFRLFDLSCGLTKISFKRFLAVVILGSLPRVFWLQLVLAGVGQAVFTSPRAVSIYLSAHPGLLAASVGYLFLIGAVFWKLRTRR